MSVGESEDVAEVMVHDVHDLHVQENGIVVLLYDHDDWDHACQGLLHLDCHHVRDVPLLRQLEVQWHCALCDSHAGIHVHVVLLKVTFPFQLESASSLVQL